MVLKLILAGIVAGLVALAGFMGGGVWLGAHPFWAVQGAIIGGAVGGIGAAVLPARRGVWVALLALLAGILAAYFGKQAFVSSYAENALAGRFWFLGYQTALAGGAGLAVYAAARGLKPR